MDNAELYTMYNSMQRKSAETVLKELIPRLTWSEAENVLDIGSGPGDVTTELLLPYLPHSASLIGVDINMKMVEYANKKYSNTSLHFQVLDFSTRNVTDYFQERFFTKIFSFYCFHWIQDQEQAAKNLYTLLRPGGEFLILAATRNQVFKVYKILSQMENWKTYMRDVNNIIPFFYNSDDPCKDIRKVLTDQGLEVIMCEERNQTVKFPSMEILMRSHEAVNPFIKRMSQDTREKYMACIEQVIDDHQLYTETVSGEIITQNPLTVVYGRRPL